jgi:AbrB family looped-hinge helix DNA binding protein
MLVEMRARSQITLPKEIVQNFGVRQGDKFEVVQRDEGILLCPVVVYPKAKIQEIAKIVKDNEKNPSVVYSNIDEMFRDLGIDLENESDV